MERIFGAMQQYKNEEKEYDEDDLHFVSTVHLFICKSETISTKFRF